MNRLAKIVQKLEKYPKAVLSFAIGRTVKFVGTAGVQFEEMTTDRVVVTLKNKKKVRNHIGQIHAAAMVLFCASFKGGDACRGMVERGAKATCFDGRKRGSFGECKGNGREWGNTN